MVNTTDADSIPQYDVFISYSHNDKAIVEQIIRDLESHDITFWWDKLISHGIGRDTPGWTNQIEIAIESSKCVLVILSPDSKTSPWVANELAYAQTLNKTIFPLLARGDPAHSTPLSLMSAQHIDICGKDDDYKRGIEQLVKAINKFLGKITKTQEAEAILSVTPAPPQAASIPLVFPPKPPRPFMIMMLLLIGFLILSLLILTASQPLLNIITATRTLPSTIDYRATLAATVTIGAQTERAITQSPVAIPTLNASATNTSIPSPTTIPTNNVIPTSNYSATIAARVQATLAARQTAAAEAIVTNASAAPTATTTPTSDVTPTPNYPATIAATVKAAQQTATAEALGTP